jgi:hypothetical protein
VRPINHKGISQSVQNRRLLLISNKPTSSATTAIGRHCSS